MNRDRALTMRRLAASFFSRWERNPMDDGGDAAHCINEAVDAIDGLQRWPSTKPEFESALKESSENSFKENCRDCDHRRMKHGESVCKLKPFDVETQEQRDIVAWLQGSQQKRCPSRKVTP